MCTGCVQNVVFIYLICAAGRVVRVSACEEGVHRDGQVLYDILNCYK